MNKTLLVYFSYTGHTKKIAEMIKNKINCDTLEIKTIIPYSKDYDSVVNDPNNQEESNYLPEIENINIDLNNYDRIIIGTPTWWYKPVPAIRSFLKKYKLDQDNIIAYSTNAGWLGKTFEEIHELCPNFKVENGMNIEFKSYTDELNTSLEKIDNWIEGLK